MKTYYRITQGNNMRDLWQHEVRHYSTAIVGVFARERASISYKLCTGQLLHISVRGSI